MSSVFEVVGGTLRACWPASDPKAERVKSTGTVSGSVVPDVCAFSLPLYRSGRRPSTTFLGTNISSRTPGHFTTSTLIESCHTSPHTSNKLSILLVSLFEKLMSPERKGCIKLSLPPSYHRKYSSGNSDFGNGDTHYVPERLRDRVHPYYVTFMCHGIFKPLKPFALFKLNRDMPPFLLNTIGSRLQFTFCLLVTRQRRRFETIWRACGE
jgi:hypothetical protein